MLQKFCGILFLGLMVHLNVLVATDAWDGERDPLGPYPRIPDKEKVKREIEFAEECRKFMKAPKQVWIRD